MIQPAEGFPRHVRQPWPWGCMSYAAYSLTGDERILADAEEMSENRHYIALHELGYFVVRMWVDQSNTVPASSAWWRWAAQQLGCAEEDAPRAPLLVSIKSPVPGPAYHAAAVLLGAERVMVLDPAAAAAKNFTLTQFLGSPYARAFTVDYLADRQTLLRLTPSDRGPEYPHITDDTRARYLASKAAA